MDKKTKIIVIWLLTGAALIATMVIIGGITRLTQSGLSMVDWKLFMGMIPPLNEQDWITTFNNYQQYPEYKIINHTMTLAEFKDIFFWEWLHRFIGRIIGLVFFFPFVFFVIKKWLNPKLTKQLIILFLLGGFQGFLGWFMVKSGLVDKPHVSHFRLAIHLLAAFLSFAYTIWIVFKLKFPQKEKFKPTFSPSLKRWNIGFLIVLTIQIIYGAFVAGLKAGQLYPTFPKMSGDWIAPVIFQYVDELGILSLSSQAASVQFIHRTLAYFVVLFAAIIVIKSSKIITNQQQSRSTTYLGLAVLLQFFLGVFTLLYQVPIVLGIAHQFGALILLTTGIYNLFWFSKN